MINENHIDIAVSAARTGEWLTANGKFRFKVSRIWEKEKDGNSPSETRKADILLEDGRRSNLYLTEHPDLGRVSTCMLVDGTLIDVIELTRG